MVRDQVSLVGCTAQPVLASCRFAPFNNNAARTVQVGVIFVFCVVGDNASGGAVPRTPPSKTSQNLVCVLHGNRGNTAREASRGGFWRSFLHQNHEHPGAERRFFVHTFSGSAKRRFLFSRFFVLDLKNKKRSLFTSLRVNANPQT